MELDEGFSRSILSLSLKMSGDFFLVTPMRIVITHSFDLFSHRRIIEPVTFPMNSREGERKGKELPGVPHNGLAAE